MTDDQAKRNMNQVAELFELMINSLARMEQKIDYVINAIEYGNDNDEDFDDANLTPFGRERNGNDVL